jgi:hypothetical protein
MPELAEDLIEGVSAIAAELGRGERWTYRALELKRLPGAFQIGRKWFFRRSKLHALIERLERGEAA